MTTPLPGGDTLRRVMRNALADGAVAAEEIDYVNAHASSTLANDAGEAIAIREVLDARDKPLAVSGTKPFYAHPLGAAGAIESAVCALALNEQWLPPTLHLEKADPACDGLDLVPHCGKPAGIRALLNNAFGFGGINATVAMRRFAR